MKAGCCGSCDQGRAPCTMPGTCGRIILPLPGAPWWRDPAALGPIIAGAKVALVTLALLGMALSAKFA